MTRVSEADAVRLALSGYVASTTDGAVVGRLRDHVFIRDRGKRLDMLAEQTTPADLLRALREVLGRADTPICDHSASLPGACMA